MQLENMNELMKDGRHNPSSKNLFVEKCNQSVSMNWKSIEYINLILNYMIRTILFIHCNLKEELFNSFYKNSNHGDDS